MKPLLCLFALLASCAAAQQRALVTDALGTPVPGVEVTIPGAPAARTDAGGIYSFAAPREGEPAPRATFTFAHAGTRLTAAAAAGDARLPLILAAPAQRKALLDFKPSVHGFRFVNRFTGSPLPFELPGLEKHFKIPDSFGLCGGMSSAAADHFLAGAPMPPDTSPPANGSPLYSHLYRRQAQSLGSLGREIARFAEWMILPDDTVRGTRRLTMNEAHALRSTLDAGRPVLLGLVYVRASESKEIWNNHQVLAYGLTERSAGDRIAFDIHIYDPNFPGDDACVIAVEQVEVAREPGAAPGADQPVYGLACTLRPTARRAKDVRGFFILPYVAGAPWRP